MRTNSLESMCELVVDCPHSTPVWTDHGKIVLRNQNIRGGRLDLSSPSYTDQDHFLGRIQRAKPRAGDIVITREAPMGEVCIIPDGLECCLGQRQVLLRPKQYINGKYLLFALQSPYVKNQISWSEGTGTTVSNIRIPVLKNIQIPRNANQEEFIAKILSTLDDKIELNRQMNATLEAMAQALFKSWFVDFDPVIDNALAAGNSIPEPLQAKAEVRAALGDQRKPLPEAIQKQFPSRFVFSEEMGWIPEGWEIKSLDEIAHYQNGLALQKFRPESNDDFLPVVKIAQLRAGFADGEEKASPLIKPECIIDDGDVIFSWSGSLLVDIWCGGKAALNQHLFKVTSTTYPKWYFYNYTKHHLEEFQHIAADKAVTMGHIKREHLSQAKCVVPAGKILKACTPFVGPLLERHVDLRKEDMRLEMLRDTLLPKLLSGELRIPDAEKLVADSV